MSYLWLTGVISAFYLFDSAMIPFASAAVHLKFVVLTLIYIGSVAELNTLFALLRRGVRRKRARSS